MVEHSEVKGKIQAQKKSAEIKSKSKMIMTLLIGGIGASMSLNSCVMPANYREVTVYTNGNATRRVEYSSSSRDAVNWSRAYQNSVRATTSGINDLSRAYATVKRANKR